MIIWCPLLVVGRGLNDRLHWAVRARINKRERGQVAWHFCEHKLRGGALPKGPYEVRLVRVFSGRERLLDDDNWIGAAKGSRDQVADELGVNDGDRQAIRFTYNQEKGQRTGVRIEISTRFLPGPPQDNKIALNNAGSVDD
jgi:hypothetical protein